MGILDFFSRTRSSRKPVIPFKDIEVSESKRGDYGRFRKKMMDSSLIILITGKRGSGKTALGMKLLEVFSNRSSRNCYIIGYRKTRLPKWIHKIESIEEAPNNSVVLIDEGAVGYFSRESMKEANRVLSKIMTVARHKNLSLLIISQNCIPLNTKILTEYGVKEVKDLVIGEKVFSYNLDINKIELKKAMISDPMKKRVITIETEDGDIIECSPDHRMLVRKDDKIVKKPAKDLTEKDELLKPLKFK